MTSSNKNRSVARRVLAASALVTGVAFSLTSTAVAEDRSWDYEGYAECMGNTLGHPLDWNSANDYCCITTGGDLVINPGEDSNACAAPPAQSPDGERPTGGKPDVTGPPVVEPPAMENPGQASQPGASPLPFIPNAGRA